jgi:hypothetical protein
MTCCPLQKSEQELVKLNTALEHTRSEASEAKLEVQRLERQWKLQAPSGGAAPEGGIDAVSSPSMKRMGSLRTIKTLDVASPQCTVHLFTAC